MSCSGRLNKYIVDSMVSAPSALSYLTSIKPQINYMYFTTANVLGRWVTHSGNHMICEQEATFCAKARKSNREIKIKTCYYMMSEAIGYQKCAVQIQRQIHKNEKETIKATMWVSNLIRSSASPGSRVAFFDCGGKQSYFSIFYVSLWFIYRLFCLLYIPWQVSQDNTAQ